MAQAQAGHGYAQILHDKVHWLFTAEDLPEWADGDGEFAICVVDITDLTPAPQLGWGYRNGVFIPPAPPDIHLLIQQKRQAICTTADSQLAALAVSYPEREVASWTQQAREAESLRADAAANTPMLDAIATARGIPRQLLAERVLAKSAAYAQVCGEIIGRRQALEDKIDALHLAAPDVVQQLENISW